MRANSGKERIRPSLHYSINNKIKFTVYILIFILNVFVFMFIGKMYTDYTQNNSKRFFNENINNVESLNAAAANAASTYIDSMGNKIDDALNVITADQMTFEETVAFLGSCNTNPKRQFQLILSGSYGPSGEVRFGDYSGISIRKILHDDGRMETVTNRILYGNGYYDTLKVFTDVNDSNTDTLCFAPEFTDPDTKLKCFAVYRHLTLMDASGQKNLYTLLLLNDSQTALNAFNMQEEYSGQSSVLINREGSYIVKSSSYRNSSFYDYIVNYNNLTTNWKERLEKLVLKSSLSESSSTNLFYKNSSGDNCVYCVAAMKNGWYSITCVPISSFPSSDPSTNYSLIILTLFLFLFVFDGIIIFFVVRLLNYNISVAKFATAEANNANQAKSRFLSTMSHELRTPLNAIIGFVALSGDSVDNPPVLKDYLNKIHISSKLLLQLINDILDVSAIESNKLKINPHPFNIGDLISALSVIYYNQCSSKDIEFNVIVKDIRYEILIGDSTRVNQILLNFLSNAIKFTPDGGQITLLAERFPQDKDSELIHFEVTDTGCGISDELKTRLFLPFERVNGDASRKYRGTGLGLSIAKSLTELMNGEIGVESTEEIGSRFWVNLPFEVPSSTAPKVFDPITDLRVLAVISNPDERDYLGHIFSNFGCTYSLAATVHEAIQLFCEAQDGPNAFSLCILDWKMADCTALEATKLIQDKLKKTAPKIMILTYDIVSAKPLCEKVGVSSLLEKPIFQSSLYDALVELTYNKPRTIPAPIKEMNLEGKRVLIVEDNKINIEVAGLLLKKIGMTTEIAMDGKEGYEMFKNSSFGYYDLILMDIQMPVMNGYESTISIRSCKHPQAATIPILAMTADAFSDDVRKALESGMNEHLSKPIDPQHLYSVIRKYLL